MSVRTTRWPLDAQTLGKHRVLEEYLMAWFPILGSRGEPILFVDGFAGPGRYAGGEEGSPLIALRCLSSHAHVGKISGAVRFIFIEVDEARHLALTEELRALSSTLPACAELHPVHGDFAGTVTDALDRAATKGASIASAFVMADPFGIDGAPMSVLGRLLRNPSCEVFVTVMGSFMHRFASQPEFARPMSELYGTEDWRTVASGMGGNRRRLSLLELYEAQLRANGARYVLRFDLFRGQAYVYSIFFATNNLLGCERMKDAIWRVMPAGTFAYQDRDATQLSMEITADRFPALERQLLALLADGEWHGSESLKDWARSDRTMYRCAVHLANALKHLEKESLVEVERPLGKRQFAPGVRVRTAR